MSNSISTFQSQVFTTAMLVNLCDQFKSHSTVASEATNQAITAVLNDSNTISALGTWSIAWGPVVYMSLAEVSINAMYIAYNSDVDTYVIGIAGTNGASLTTWLFEDAAVGAQYALPFTNSGSNGVMISGGALSGVSNLMKMPDPSTGLTALQYLTNNATSGSTVYVCGHSLGGTLAPVFALYLKNELPSLNLYCMPVAGPTPGNGDFASYYNSMFPSPYNLSIWNEMDVAPHLYQVSMMQEIDNIYNPPIKIDLMYRGIIFYLYELAKNLDYTQIDTYYSFSYPLFTPGDINPPPSGTNTTWPTQVTCQHVAAYGLSICNQDLLANITSVFNGLTFNIPGLEGVDPLSGPFFTYNCTVPSNN